MHISTEDEQTAEGERTVTLTGTPESVLLAQFLVQSNIDLFKKDHQQQVSLLHIHLMATLTVSSFRVASWTPPFLVVETI